MIHLGNLELSKKIVACVRGGVKSKNCPVVRGR
jgi:hypothetical protein